MDRARKLPKFFVIEWSGKLVSENRRHVIRNGRIYAGREYEAFVRSLAWTIRSSTQQATPLAHPKVELIVRTKRRIDKQNILKPVCDAIERAGLVDNDRNLGTIVISDGGKPISDDGSDELVLTLLGREQ